MAEPSQNGETPARRIGVREFRGNLSGFLREAQQGALRVRIWMAPDFDTLPPDVLAAMEGEEE